MICVWVDVGRRSLYVSGSHVDCTSDGAARVSNSLIMKVRVPTSKLDIKKTPFLILFSTITAIRITIKPKTNDTTHTQLYSIKLGPPCRIVLCRDSYQKPEASIMQLVSILSTAFLLASQATAVPITEPEALTPNEANLLAKRANPAPVSCGRKLALSLERRSQKRGLTLPYSFGQSASLAA